MVAFKFRLGRLSRVRDIQERNARNIWAAAEAIARNHREVVEHFENEIVRGREDLALIQAEEAMDIADVLRTQGLIERLGDRRAVAEERARTSRFQADQLQETWQQAKSDAHALERLEERELAEYQLEERKLESTQMDEVAIQRNAAANRSGRMQAEDSNR